MVTHNRKSNSKLNIKSVFLYKNYFNFLNNNQKIKKIYFYNLNKNNF